MKEFFQTTTTTNQTIDMAPCPVATASTDLSALFTPNGIITAAVDSMTTFNVATFVAERMSGSYLQSRPQIIQQSGNAADGQGTTEYVRDNLGKLIDQDGTLLKNLKDEYCHYQSRYSYALKDFLNAITTPNSDTAQTKLEMTKKLNKRLNAMLEVLDYLGKQRVQFVNDNAALIDSTGETIKTQLTQMKNTAEIINSTNAITETQKEMMRFTEEKNNHIRNQISLWASLNILALGVVFYVYRKM